MQRPITAEQQQQRKAPSTLQQVVRQLFRGYDKENVQVRAETRNLLHSDSNVSTPGRRPKTALALTQSIQTDVMPVVQKVPVRTMTSVATQTDSLVVPSEWIQQQPAIQAPKAEAIKAVKSQAYIPKRILHRPPPVKIPMVRVHNARMQEIELLRAR